MINELVGRAETSDIQRIIVRTFIKEGNTDTKEVGARGRRGNAGDAY